jgi:hypothetical protein
VPPLFEAVTAMGNAKQYRSLLIERVRAKYAKVGRPAFTKSDLLARAIQDGLINLRDIS